MCNIIRKLDEDVIAAKLKDAGFGDIMDTERPDDFENTEYYNDSMNTEEYADAMIEWLEGVADGSIEEEY